jgi:hypothetical protein
MLQVKPALAAAGKEPLATYNLLAKLGGAWRSKSSGMGKSAAAKRPGLSMDGARVRACLLCAALDCRLLCGHAAPTAAEGSLSGARVSHQWF